jgi:hypothetical protein
VTLGTRPTAIRGVRFSRPFFAGMLDEPDAARDQSMRPREPVEQETVQPVPNARPLLFAQPTPAGGPASAARRAGPRLPRAAGAEHEKDSRKRPPVGALSRLSPPDGEDSDLRYIEGFCNPRRRHSALGIVAPQSTGRLDRGEVPWPEGKRSVEAVRTQSYLPYAGCARLSPDTLHCGSKRASNLGHVVCDAQAGGQPAEQHLHSTR